MNQTLKEFIEQGGEIHYAPVSGGLLLMKKGERVVDVDYSIADFLELQESGAIVMFDSMRQGHSYFPGRVQMYRKA